MTNKPDHARFEVWQDGMMVAAAEGARHYAERDALHYAMVYGQDGPVSVYQKVGRKLVLFGSAASLEPK